MLRHFCPLNKMLLYSQVVEAPLRRLVLAPMGPLLSRLLSPLVVATMGHAPADTSPALQL